MSEKTLKNTEQKEGFIERHVTIVSSLIAVFFGLVVALIVLMVSRPDQGWNGFLMLLLGGIPYGGMKNVGDTLYYAIPIMCTGVALCLAFKTGVFNIGGPGQYIIGAYAGIYVAIKFGESFPQPLSWIIPLIASFVAGGLWATIPAILRAYLNVNPVIGTIMFNYIGMYYSVYWVRSYIFDQTRGQSLPTPKVSQIPKGFLADIFPGSSVDIGIFIAILACILVWILLEKTTRGYEMKACGMNADATTYDGINSKFNIMFALIFSGALCGLGGGLHYLASSGVYIKVIEQSAAEGFTGIAIACLAGNNPIGAIFAAIYMAFLTVGGQYMQLFGFQKEIVSVITGVVIYFSSFVLLMNSTIIRFLAKRRLAKSGKKEEVVDIRFGKEEDNPETSVDEAKEAENSLPEESPESLGDRVEEEKKEGDAE